MRALAKSSMQMLVIQTTTIFADGCFTCKELFCGRETALQNAQLMAKRQRSTGTMTAVIMELTCHNTFSALLGNRKFYAMQCIAPNMNREKAAPTTRFRLNAVG